MIARWRELQDTFPVYYDVIGAGISKLTEYHDHLTTIPAYTRSICKSNEPILVLLLLMVETVLNPSMKLNWFKHNMPGRVEEI